MDWAKVERLLQPPINKHCWFALVCMLIHLRQDTKLLFDCIERAIETAEQKSLIAAVERSGLLPVQNVINQLGLAERNALYCTNREFANTGRALRKHQQRIDLLLTELLPDRGYRYVVRLDGRLRYYA